MYSIGVDIGGSHISVGLVNETGSLVKKEELNVISASKERIIEIIIMSIRNWIESGDIKIDDINHIGICSPGQCTSGRLLNLVNFSLVEEFNVVEDLKSAISKFSTKEDIEISIINDANAATIGELEAGSLKDAKNAIFLTFGTGIGGGIVINGKLYTGKNGIAGELGHVQINSNGEKCSCGKVGCFETFCSLKRLKERISKELGISEVIHGQELIRLLEDKDEIAKKHFDEYKRNLIIGISNYIAIFDPEVIGIGGSLAYLEKFYINELREGIKDATINKDIDVRIKTATLKNDAGIIGAAVANKY